MVQHHAEGKQLLHLLLILKPGIKYYGLKDFPSE